MARKQSLPCQGRQVSRARLNLLVHRQEARYSPWSTGFYRSARRRYNFGIFESSTTTRTLPPRRNPTLLTVKSMRVVKAEDSAASGHLPCTKTAEVRGKEEFKGGRKEEEEIMNEEKEKKEEGEEEEEENEEEEKEVVEEEEVKTEEKREVMKQEKEEKKEEEQEGQEEDKKEKVEKEGRSLLKEAEGQDNKKRGTPSSHEQKATPRALAAKAETIPMRQAYGPQEGSQHPQDLPQYVGVTALVCPKQFPYGFSCPSSLSPDRHNTTLGQANEDALGCPQPVSTSSSTHQETFLRKELELTGLPGSADSQEPQEKKLGRSPQVTVLGSCAIPMPALKQPHKRKGARLELLLPPSEPLPPPALLQQLWEQANLPPPPKIPRIDTETEFDTRKNMKGQAIQISDEKVDALKPKTQVMSVHSVPQPVLPIPPPASEPAASLSLPTDGVSSLGPPASTPLLCQTSGPPIPSVPAPSLTSSIPTVPISPALHSDSLSPVEAMLCVETPLDVKKDPTNLPIALAPANFHLPKPGPEPLPLSFNPPFCKTESPTPMCISSHSPLFPATSPALWDPPTVFPTTAPHACEDMNWEPSSGPTVMDMDTTPPSEASILSSPTVSSGSSLPFVLRYGCMQPRLAANATMSIDPPAFGVPCHTPFGNNLYTPSAINGQNQGVSSAGGDPGVWIQPGLVPAFPPMSAITTYPAMDFEFMDTTPPSKAVIFHSSPVTNSLPMSSHVFTNSLHHVSNSLPPQSVWGSTTACNHTGATSLPTPVLLNGPQPDGCVFMRKPSTAPTAAVDLTSLSGKHATCNKTQPSFAGPSPADRARRCSTKKACGKLLCDSNIATPTSGLTLSSGMGSGDCSSPSTSSTPSTPALMKPLEPQCRKNSSHAVLMHECKSIPRYQIVKKKGKGSGSVDPIILKRCR